MEKSDLRLSPTSDTIDASPSCMSEVSSESIADTEDQLVDKDRQPSWATAVDQKPSHHPSTQLVKMTLVYPLIG